MNRWLLAGVVAVGLLAGCSDAPTESDLQPLIEEAAREVVLEQRQEMGEARAERMGIARPEELTIHDVSIMESKRLDNGDYEVRVSSIFKVGERTSEGVETFVVRYDDGWRVVGQGGNYGR